MTDRRSRFQLPSLRSTPSHMDGPPEPAPEVSMEARPEDVAAPVEQSVVDAAIQIHRHQLAAFERHVCG